MHVAVAARSGELLTGLVDKIGSAGGVAFAFPADLSVSGAPEAFVAATFGRFGRVDLVVNNAGATKRGDFLELSETDWAEGFTLKFLGAVRMSHAAWPHLTKTSGSIVNIAGIGGRTGAEDFTIGGSVNAALLNFTKALADRGNREGVRVNVINPGYILTDRLTKRVTAFAEQHGLSVEKAAGRMASESKIPRFGEPREIARAVAFLASAASAYTNGAIFDIDGGLTRTL
jgi:3-oxoacyl-[acyl-carrier protein] reductase